MIFELVNINLIIGKLNNAKMGHIIKCSLNILPHLRSTDIEWSSREGSVNTALLFFW